MAKLPSGFNDFSQTRKDGFLEIKNVKEAGKNVVGVFCTYTPVELIWAAGAVCVAICSFSDESIPDAEKILPRNLCPLIKSSYGFAVTETCPYTYFSDLLVGETTCDGKKKMYELLAEIKDMHVMQLPQEQESEGAKRLWLDEIYVLKEALEKKFNVEITEDKVREAIKLRNKERILLKELYELGKLTPPPLSGIKQLQALYGSQFKFNIEEKLVEIRKTIDKIKEDYENGERPFSEKAKRILVTGCPLAGATEKVVTAIEESGGVVVGYENCVGAKTIDELVDENAEPFQAIADRYLRIGCSVMTPDNNRYKLLTRLIDEFKVDGVVEMTLQACLTYDVETAYVRRCVQEKGLPFISVETDYSAADSAQLKNRLAAFIEMME